MLNRERQGELFIFSSAALWGLFPIVTILSYTTLSPLLSLAWSTLFAACFFAISLTIKKRWSEIRALSALQDILLATFFLGILYYVFFFFALRYTSAGNASLLGLSEIFFSFLFFNVWKKEHISLSHILGSLFMMAGALIVLWPNVTRLNIGDVLVVAASMIAPFGNFFQQRARKTVRSDGIMFLRSIIVATLIFFFLWRSDPAILSLSTVTGCLLFLLVNGFLLLGLSKVFWIESIHHISVTKANALSSITPLLTIFFAFVFLKDAPTVWQISSFVPLFLGSVLLTKN